MLHVLRATVLIGVSEMKNFKDKLVRFMSGRYGIDQLYYALLAVFFVLAVADALIRSPTISALLGILIYGVLIWMVFRTFSRNVYQRRLENEKFMKLWNPVKARSSLTIRRIKEIKTHFANAPIAKQYFVCREERESIPLNALAATINLKYAFYCKVLTAHDYCLLPRQWQGEDGTYFPIVYLRTVSPIDIQTAENIPRWPRRHRSFLGGDIF
jgi:hypothetical protein